MLAHVAAAEAVRRARLPWHDGRMDYSAVPSGIFTSPEIGCGACRSAGFRGGPRCAYGHVPDARTRQGAGHERTPPHVQDRFDGATGKVLGVHIAGAHATDLIAEAGLALRLGASVRDIAATIHAHPTLAEGLYEAALSLVEAGG
ncbi:MAG: hypothetical protein ACLT2T_04855 [Bilophila wadsworthia]